MIKLVSAFIAAPLTHLVNLSFETGVIPKELRQANITPIFKNGDSCLPQNYRPISVLRVFSKVFERLLHNRLFEFFNSNNIISQYQYGFRKKFSTEMALIHTTETITRELDKGNKAIGLFLDLKKAFDTVNLDILLIKLQHYGIRGIALKLIENY